MFPESKVLVKAAAPIAGIAGFITIAYSLISVVYMFLGSTYEILNTIITLSAYATYIGFFGLYIWGGHKVAKEQGLDPFGAGVVTAVSHLFAGFLTLIIGILFELLLVLKIFKASNFPAAEPTVVLALFGDLSGVGGLLIEGVCWAGLIVLGALINFAIGAIGGIIAHRGK